MARGGERAAIGGEHERPVPRALDSAHESGIVSTSRIHLHPRALGREVHVGRADPGHAPECILDTRDARRARHPRDDEVALLEIPCLRLRVREVHASAHVVLVSLASAVSQIPASAGACCAVARSLSRTSTTCGYASERQHRHDEYQARIPASMFGSSPVTVDRCTSSPPGCAWAPAAVTQASIFGTYAAGSAANFVLQPAEQNPYSRAASSTTSPSSRASARSTTMSQIGSRIFALVILLLSPFSVA